MMASATATTRPNPQKTPSYPNTLHHHHGLSSESLPSPQSAPLSHEPQHQPHKFQDLLHAFHQVVHHADKQEPEKPESIHKHPNLHPAKLWSKLKNHVSGVVAASHIANHDVQKPSLHRAATFPEDQNEHKEHESVKYSDEYYDQEATSANPIVCFLSGELPDGSFTGLMFNVVAHDRSTGVQDIDFLDEEERFRQTWFEVFRVIQPKEDTSRAGIVSILKRKCGYRLGSEHEEPLTLEEEALISGPLPLSRVLRDRPGFLRDEIFMPHCPSSVQPGDGEIRNAEIEFIHSLQPKDRIAVMARAKGSLMSNVVKYVEVDVGHRCLDGHNETIREFECVCGVVHKEGTGKW